MSTAKRVTQATQILNDSKILEKSTPGPVAYKNAEVKLALLPKIPAACKLNENRTTWIDKAKKESDLKPSPGKYPAIDLNKIKERSRQV